MPNLAHRIALDLNNRERTYCARAAGVRRVARNWALQRWGEQYAAHKADPTLPKPTEAKLRKELNRIKRQQFPWMLEVTKCAPQQAIMDLGQAFENFFEGRARYPKPHTKRKSRTSFGISNDQFKVAGKRLWIPNLGWVCMTETIRYSGKLLAATISRTADTWYVSFSIEVPDTDAQLHKTRSKACRADTQGVVGVDLGITDLAALSTGEKVPGPKPLKRHLRRIRRLSQALSRKRKGSRNRDKAKRRLSREHARVARKRNDALHKLTTLLCRHFAHVAIEDLGVKGMVRNHKLARAIHDMGWGEFRRQLDYKAKLYGCTLHIIDRFEPTSKRCNECSHTVEKLPLQVRAWECPACGAHHDRDINAAINIALTAVSYTVAACGAASSGLRVLRPQVKLAAVKQEFSGKPGHAQVCLSLE